MSAELALCSIASGFGVSLFVGWGASWGTVVLIERTWIAPELGDADYDPKPSVPSWFVGLVERVFFTVAVGLNLTGVLPGMLAWVVAKMAANWEQGRGNESNKIGPQAVRARRLRSASGTVVSLLFALIGGKILQYYGGLSTLMEAAVETPLPR